MQHVVRAVDGQRQRLRLALARHLLQQTQQVLGEVVDQRCRRSVQQRARAVQTGGRERLAQEIMVAAHAMHQHIEMLLPPHMTSASGGDRHAPGR